MTLKALCVTEHRGGRGGKVPYTTLLPRSFKITMFSYTDRLTTQPQNVKMQLQVLSAQIIIIIKRTMVEHN